MESQFSNVVASNDVQTIDNYLKENLATVDELLPEINSIKDDKIKNLLTQYYYLSTYDLKDSLCKDHQNKKINNLMIISVRGYLPLLKLKKDQASNVTPSGLAIINQKSADGNTALHYALKDPKNIKMVKELIAMGAKINIWNRDPITPDIIIEEYSEKLDDLELRKQYQELYDQISPEDNISLFQKLPVDIIGLLFDDPEVMLKICKSYRYMDRKYCQNQEYWKRKYINTFRDEPEDPNIIKKSYREQYTMVYEFFSVKDITQREIVINVIILNMYNLANKLINEYNQDNIDELFDNMDVLDDFTYNAFKYKKTEHINTVFTKLPTNDYALSIMAKAAGESGDVEMINILLDPNNFKIDHPGSLKIIYNKIHEGAAIGGHLNIIKNTVHRGAIFYNNALVEAARKRHIEIVYYLISLNYRIDAKVLMASADGGDLEIFKLVEGYIVNNDNNITSGNFQDMFENAIEHDSHQIIDYILTNSLYNDKFIIYPLAANLDPESNPSREELINIRKYQALLYQSIIKGNGRYISLAIQKLRGYHNLTMNTINKTIDSLGQVFNEKYDDVLEQLMLNDNEYFQKYMYQIYFDYAVRKANLSMIKAIFGAKGAIGNIDLNRSIEISAYELKTIKLLFDFVATDINLIMYRFLTPKMYQKRIIDLVFIEFKNKLKEKDYYNAAVRIINFNNQTLRYPLKLILASDKLVVEDLRGLYGLAAMNDSIFQDMICNALQ